eukprot:421519-Pleurochrysis_carterae.AAC.1
MCAPTLVRWKQGTEKCMGGRQASSQEAVRAARKRASDTAARQWASDAAARQWASEAAARQWASEAAARQWALEAAARRLPDRRRVQTCRRRGGCTRLRATCEQQEHMTANQA